MRNLRLMGLAGLALALLARPAASQMERRATFVDGGSAGSGSCTIQVNVDRTAEVTLAGDRAFVQSIGGGPATLGNVECTGPLPCNMTEFKVQTIMPAPRSADPSLIGRLEPNQVQLVEDPRTNGGNAVVRFHDPVGGSGTYTLQVTWNGANSFMPLPPDRQRHTETSTTFRGAGDGFLRGRDFNDRLVSCSVTLDGDLVQASFVTADGTPIDLSGRVHHADRNHVVADMSGSGIYGTMSIDLDQGRVKNVAMSNGGRNSFDLRWHY
jgi:hypothetical protein